MIKRILTLSEVRYWIGVMYDEVWVQRRGHLFALIIQVIGLFGISVASFSFILMPMGSKVGLDNKLDPIYPDDQPSITIPLSPGSTSALRICKDGSVDSGQVHVDGGSNPDVRGYVAVFGAERLTYTNNPPDGSNNVVILNGNSQVIQKDVTECLIERGK